MTEQENEEFDLFGDPEMMKLFMELHSGNPREGPGDDKSTLEALGIITDQMDLPDKPRILDVGCGPGMQTVCLAEATTGDITALDFFPQFLDQLERTAGERGVGDRIELVKGDMKEMPFEEESFDIIWSEGAIYIMGFENGLREWKRFLRHGGGIAVSQITWLKDTSEIPKDLYDWWMENCPDIRTIGENLAIIEKLGYEVLGHFTLPESAWLEGYYPSLRVGLERMREKYPNNEKVAALIEMELEEQTLYANNSDCYGYEFYVMRKC